MVGLVAVAIDQILRGQAVLSEWWVDLPLAALVAALFVHATQRRHQPPGPRPLDAIGEVMHAVSRGRHVDDVLESLTRQACRIIDVERAVVVVRDDTDPRLATVIAGHGVPSDYVGRRIGIDEGMAGRVITSGEPVLVDDYGKFPRRIAHAAGADLRAGAAVPICRDGVVQGALAAGTTVPGRRFGGNELEALLRLAELGAVAIEQARMREELETAVEAGVEAGVEAMAAAVDMRDDYTGTHSEEVVRLARSVGECMGMTQEQLSELEFAARLHDVGKIGVPDAVLLKPGKLTPEEWQEMRKHPDIGFQMIQNIPFLATPAQIVLSHQERWDGQGYPRNLRGQEIHIGARIFAVADTLDAMTSDRPVLSRLACAALNSRFFASMRSVNTRSWL